MVNKREKKNGELVFHKKKNWSAQSNQSDFISMK